jgi:predicted RNA polymerase sigma factor
MCCTRSQPHFHCNASRPHRRFRSHLRTPGFRTSRPRRHRLRRRQRYGWRIGASDRLSPEADAENQLAMMFAICDGSLSAETHVTLILRLLCGLSSNEIARAFLVDVPTIDRRLHRGRGRLQKLGSTRVITAAIRTIRSIRRCARTRSDWSR